MVPGNVYKQDIRTAFSQWANPSALHPIALEGSEKKNLIGVRRANKKWPDRRFPAISARVSDLLVRPDL